MSHKEDILRDLKRVLLDARGRMEACLKGGEYDELVELADVAKSLESFVAGVASGSASRPESAASPPKAATSRRRSGPARNGRKGSARQVPGAQDRQVPKAADYPFFLKDNDKLVKVAWSGKDQQEYEHRAPRDAITSLLDAIKKKTKKSKLFQVDDILPVENGKSGTVLPTYQVYLVIAWMRQCGLIEKVGRYQYRLHNSVSAKGTADKCWNELASK